MKKEPSIEIKELKEHTGYSVVCTLDNSNNVKVTVSVEKTSSLLQKLNPSYASFQLDQPH